MTFVAKIRVIAVALVLSSVLSVALCAAPAVLTMDARYLDQAKQRVGLKDALLRPSFDKLIKDAEAALALAPESVTYKKVMPPSGDKHDYMSLAPYWWPDPEKADGLPYVQRDGEFNPSAKNGDTDSVRLQVLCMAVQKLSLAYFFTEDRRYAKKAAVMIRTWFLDAGTRMAPHLRYGQAVMGRVDGRGIGLIDTRNFWMVVDGALLIEATGELSAEEMAELRGWFKEFSDWMLTSDIGIEEFNAPNNHGMFYDMQVANYALFTGDLPLAKRAVQRAMDLRMASQVSSDGRQLIELERTTPFHYSAFNLDAMTNLARYGEQVKVNVWKTREKGRGLKMAVDFLVPFAVRPEGWPYKELRRVETETALPVLLKAERGWGGGAYRLAAGQLVPSSQEAQENLALASAINQPLATTQNALEWLIWAEPVVAVKRK